MTPTVRAAAVTAAASSLSQRWASLMRVLAAAEEAVQDAMDLEDELMTQLVDAHGYLLKVRPPRCRPALPTLLTPAAPAPRDADAA